MSTFYLVCYAFSLALSLTTFVFGIFVGKERFHTIRVLPKALRLYLMTCGFPFFFLTSLCSFYMSVFYLINHTQIHYTNEIARNLISFSSQQIRNAFIFTIIERIVATVKLERHKSANKNSLFWWMALISYSTSASYLIYNIYAKSMPDKPWMYNITNYYAYSAHVFMLTVCGLLYLTNRRMYRISAYRITLKRRYTIAQNIKSLKYLFPSILIYSVCAQFGSMITILFEALSLPTAPLCIYHIFFNLSFLLIYFRHYCIHIDTTTQVKNITTVKNPLGTNIPTKVTSDQYFNTLQNQWR